MRGTDAEMFVRDYKLCRQVRPLVTWAEIYNAFPYNRVILAFGQYEKKKGEKRQEEPTRGEGSGFHLKRNSRTLILLATSFLIVFTATRAIHRLTGFLTRVRACVYHH